MPPPLLFYCQHSAGTGQLTRSLALTRSLKTRFDVTLVMGGELPPGFPSVGSDQRTVLLPPVGVDQMGRLVSHDSGRPLLRSLAERRRILLETYRAVKPRVLVI